MPPEGQDLREHLEGKYGKVATRNFGDPNSRLYQMGRKAGIDFNMDRRMVNTIAAHALVEAVKEAKGNDAANQLMERLYELYFVQAKDISDVNLLTELAVNEFGMDAREAAMIMATGSNDVLVKDRKVKRGWGVSGVPFYVIYPNDNNNNGNNDANSKKQPIAFSGAYPPEIIAEQLKEAAGQCDA